MLGRNSGNDLGHSKSSPSSSAFRHTKATRRHNARPTQWRVSLPGRELWDPPFASVKQRVRADPSFIIYCLMYDIPNFVTNIPTPIDHLFLRSGSRRVVDTEYRGDGYGCVSLRTCSQIPVHVLLCSLESPPHRRLTSSSSSLDLQEEQEALAAFDDWISLFASSSIHRTPAVGVRLSPW